jgi:hypothetical protein
MSKYLISLMALVILASTSWSQDENAGDAPGTDPDEQAVTAPAGSDATATDEDGADEEAVDDADLDMQTYDEDDDDFIPSEEIPADEPIPFPSNI